jgi:hypothetical protein
MIVSNITIVFILIGVIGVVLMLTAIAPRTRGSPRTVLISFGAILTVIGILGVTVSLLYKPSSPTVLSPSPSPSNQPKSILKTPLAGGGISAANTATQSPSASLSWSDSDSSTGVLEDVVEFSIEDAPLKVSATGRKRIKRRAHSPKAVPATPMRRKRRKKIVEDGGYESASAPHTPMPPIGCDADDMPITTGPVYYTPPKKFPSVSDLSVERQQFMSLPNTPELDRQRRINGLVEAALSMRMDTGRPGSGFTVPIGMVGQECITPPEQYPM